MKNYIISALVIFLIAMGVMMFLTLPEYDKFISLTWQLQDNKLELVERERHLSDMFELSQRLKQQQAALDKISSALPAHPDFPSLMVFLNEKASESGLIVLKPNNVSTVYHVLREEDVEQSSPGIKPIEFDLFLTGKYPSLKNFVQSVESSSRLIQVSNIVATKDEDLSLYVYQITLETSFYQN